MVKTTSKTMSRKGAKEGATEPAAPDKGPGERESEAAPKNHKDLDLPGLRALRRPELLKVAKAAKLSLDDMPRTLLLRALEVKLELA
tara:strand:+ start:62 stop:322 length:261 start_codon:yes stop_codon:yes gene_type:complete